MEKQPLVSILIPVYNADKKIAKAIISCIKQSYKPIEIIVLNDGSTDFTSGELNKYSAIKVISHDENLGTSVSRNDLLKAASGEFIAWLDADDHMVLDRIERQVKYLQEHPEVDIVGSWVNTDNSSFPKKRVPTDPEIIHSYLWFKNCMVHSSLMSRNFYVKENVFYNTGFKSNVEDDEIWYRLSKLKVMANMPEYLTNVHLPLIKDVEQKHRKNQYETELNQIWEAKWKDIKAVLTSEQKQLFQMFLYKMELLNYGQLKDVKSILNKLETRENRMMIHFYKLLIYVRLNFIQRLFNLDLLTSMFRYSALKRRQIVQ